MSYGSGGYGSGGYGSGGYGSGGGYGSNGSNNGGSNYEPDNGSSGYGTGGYSNDDDYGYGNSGGGKTPAKKLFGSNKGYVDGIVAGYEVEQDNTGFLGAWFKSLFLGIPFAVKSQKHIFQLVADEFNSDSACTEVHLCGEISSGKINNGERVRVYGNKTVSGAYLAKKIVKTNNNMKVTMKKAMPAFIVRVVTILLLAIIIGVATNFSGMGSGTGTGGTETMGNLFNAELWKQILAGAIVILTLVFGGKIRNMTGLSMKVLWIIAAVLVSLLIPEVGATIVVICILIWAIKLMMGIR